MPPTSEQNRKIVFNSIEQNRRKIGNLINLLILFFDFGICSVPFCTQYGFIEHKIRKKKENETQNCEIENQLYSITVN